MIPELRSAKRAVSAAKERAALGAVREGNSFWLVETSSSD